jgi:hypothetical protein
MRMCDTWRPQSCFASARSSASRPFAIGRARDHTLRIFFDAQADVHGPGVDLEIASRFLRPGGELNLPPVFPTLSGEPAHGL